MDKNMINIDEFVKQRLEGVEENERAGAWLNMRDLLDEKMPLSPVKGVFNWRKYLAATGSLLLLTLFSFGGYELLSEKNVFTSSLGKIGSASSTSAQPTEQKFSADKKATSFDSQHAQEANAIVNSSSARTENNSSTTAIQKPTTTYQTADKINKEVALNTLKTKSTTTTNKVAKEHKAQTVNKTSKHQELTTSKEAVGSKEAVISNKSINTQPLVSNNPQHLVGHSTPLPSNTSVTTTSTNNTAGSTTTPPKATSELLRTSTSNHPSTTNATTTGGEHNATANQEATVSSGNSKPNQSIDNLVTSIDSIRKITVVERTKVNPKTKAVSVVRDTLSIGKMAIEQPVASSKSQGILGNSANASNEVQPQSGMKQQLTVAEADSKGLTNLSSKKVKSSKSGMYSSDAFRQRIENTKFRLQQVRFYPGITFGMNSFLFGPSSMMGGYQVGMSGIVKFDEKWSMLAELKFIQRFNQNMKVSDNYWKIGTITGNEYEANFIEHYFKFSTVNSVELPLAIRYAYKRLQCFAGGNFVYNFNVNPEEVTRMYEVNTYQGNSFERNTVTTIAVDDFGSRFSIGYLLGAGYEVTPAFLVDLRMTNNFWDNAAGSGPRKVSKQLYYQPSFQLSVTYRLPARNRIPRAQ